MLETIVLTLMLCYQGSLDCSIMATKEMVLIQVCNTMLGEHDGRLERFVDKDFTFIIKQVNCEDV